MMDQPMNNNAGVRHRERPAPLGSDKVLWGLCAIGGEIGRTSKTTLKMIRSGRIPAQRDGARWFILRSALWAAFRKAA